MPIDPQQNLNMIDNLANPFETRHPQNFKNLQELRNKCSLLRQKVCNFLTKLDVAPNSLDYNTCLNNLNLIYSEINGVLRFIDSDRYQELIHRHTIMPISVLNEVDNKLKTTTENRIPFFNHEVIPNVLRSKHDLDIENNDNQINIEAMRKFGSINSAGILDVKKLNTLDESITVLQKMVSRAIEKLEKTSKSQGSAASDLNSKQHKLNNSKEEHTYQLINIYRFGIGLVNNHVHAGNSNLNGNSLSGNHSNNNQQEMGNINSNNSLNSIVEGKKETKGKKGGNKRKQNVTTTLSVNQ